MIMKDGDNKTVHVVVEASITVDDHGINWDLERAMVLGHLTSAPVRAAAIGRDISTAYGERADELGVTFMPLGP